MPVSRRAATLPAGTPWIRDVLNWKGLPLMFIASRATLQWSVLTLVSCGAPVTFWKSSSCASMRNVPCATSPSSSARPSKTSKLSGRSCC